MRAEECACLINDYKNIRNESNEWKIQLNMSINFISFNDAGEIPTFFVWSDNEEIRSGNETDDIIKRLLKSFLTNYQNEEKILRNESNFIFESFFSQFLLLLFYRGIV